jgi:Fe-S cluster assembly ATP-binding protein
MLILDNLSVALSGKALLSHISLKIAPGTVHVCMGPNGSGKSSLAFTLMGHPRYEVTSGSINFNEIDITLLSVDKRARMGMFLSLQQPYEIPGVLLGTFLKEAFYAVHPEMSLDVYVERLTQALRILKMDGSFLQRGLYEGFSGGEKKRCEMLQLLVLQPQLAILDELDSGLDVDALALIGAALQAFKKLSPTSSLFIITHYQRMAQLVTPDVVHVLQGGSLVATGGPELIEQVENKGYTQGGF